MLNRKNRVPSQASRFERRSCFGCLRWLIAVSACLMLATLGLAADTSLGLEPYFPTEPWGVPLPQDNLLTSNQRHVASAFNSVIASHKEQFSWEHPIQPQTERTLLDSLSGEIYGSLPTLGLQIAGSSLRAVSNRIINTDSFLNDSDELGSGMAMSSPLGSSRPGMIVRGQPSVTYASGWLQGYGTSGGLRADGNASTSDFGIGGLAYGIDLGRDESGVIGITGGNSYSSFNNSLSSSAQVNSFQAGIYALKRRDASYAFGVLNYGHNRYDVDRIAGTGVAPSSTHGSFTGHQFGSYGEIGWNFDSSILRLQPFSALQYVQLTNGQTTESGPLGISVASANFRSLQAHLGARLIAHHLTDSRGRRWSPYFSARWAREILKDEASAFATMNGVPAVKWTVTGNQPANHLGMIGPGLTVELARGVTLFGLYEYQWGSHFRAVTGSGGLLFTF